MSDSGSADDSYSRQLQEWPYDWAVTERTLDPRLLSAHGQFMLNRALNTRSVVVFAGSGMSSVYGRVSWKDLTVSHMEALHAFLKPHETKQGAAIKLDPQVKLLFTRLQGLISQARDGTNRALMLGMQVCEQIWSTCKYEDKTSRTFMRDLAAEFGLLDKYKELTAAPIQQPELGQKLFRHWMKVETYDELSHVRRVVHGGFGFPLQKLLAGASDLSGENPKSPARRQTEFEWIPDSSADDVPPQLEWLYQTQLQRFRKADRKYLPIFGERALGEIKKNIGEGSGKKRNENDKSWPDDSQGAINLARVVLELVEKHGFANEAGSRLPLLQPSHYFAVGLILDLCRWSLRSRFADGRKTAADLKKATEKAIKDRKKLFDSLRTLLKPGENPGVPNSRSSIIPPDRDPLYRLYYDFEIKRFVTTNYDLEIERLMEDLGFVQPNHEAVNRLPDYDIERVSSLGGRARDIDLNSNTAIDLVDFAANESPHDITVVHLHGRATDESELVVTERDYQTRYMRDDPSQKMIREGLDVLFGGNPILFVGLGLSEDDLMRPLRQFVSNPTRFKRNRTLIAFVPPTEDTEKRNAEAMEIYARYGVSVVYFGQWTAETTADNDRSYWLHWVYQDAKTLSTTLKTLAGPLANEPLQKAIGTECPKLTRLFDDNCRTAGDEFKKQFFAEATHHLFDSDGQACDIRLPLNLLITIRDQVLEESRRKKRTPQGDKLFAEACRDVLQPAAERAINAILSAALSAKLAGAAVGWRNWWERWKKPPADRTNSIAYPEPVADKPDGSSHKWTRYHIDDAVARAPIGERDGFYEHGFGFFLNAVKASQSPYDGRRIFVVAARRGDGKGHFFSTLTSQADHILTHPDQRTRYGGAFFASFTFSAEIASVWDALIAFLAAPDRRETPQTSLREWAKKEKNTDITRLSRVERLQLVLGDRSKRPQSKSGERLLVAFNAADLLVEPDGYPKNAEIRMILDLLLDPCHAEAPIDFIFIVRNDHLPLHFQAPSCPTDSPVVAQRRKDISRSLCATILFPDPPPSGETTATEHHEQAKRNAIEVMRKCRITIAAWPAGFPGIQPSAIEIEKDPKAAAERCFYFHVLNRADPLRHFRDFDFQHPAKPASAEDIRKFDEQFDLAKRFREVGQNRFLFSVVLSALREILEKKKEAAGAFLQSIEHSSSASEIGVEERVLHRVLDLYATQLHDPASDHGHPLLCDAILRHLAVIAVPIDDDVLSHCPGIQRVIGHISETKTGVADRSVSGDAQEMRKTLVSKALGLLVARGLVFKIRRYDAKETLWRYAVHRLVQLYVYRRLSVQPVEPTEGNFFTISLYASQQAGLPMLNASAYAFVDELINHLICYAGRSSNFADPKLRAWCLRAGLSITRTLLPLGVVSRFADLPGLGPPTPLDAGHIEHRRLAVRWMLKAAVDHHDEPKSGWSPFYRDEIMWLYNECGVFSLAQGNMHDAHALFGQALQQARGASSPMRRRLLLNQGLAAMHRGRLPEARRWFVEIMEGEGEHFGLKFMAEGYLGSCDHLEGQLEAAGRHYEKAFKGLLAIPRLRAASIVARNSGDLVLAPEQAGRSKRGLRDIDPSRRILGRGRSCSSASDCVDACHAAGAQGRPRRRARPLASSRTPRNTPRKWSCPTCSRKR